MRITIIIMTIMIMIIIIIIIIIIMLIPTGYRFSKNCFLFAFYSDVDSFKDQFPERLENSARETEKTFRHQYVISLVIKQRVRNHSVIAPIYKLFNLAYR